MSDVKEYDTPGPGRCVMFPTDLFDRPSYRRLARRWPQTLAWWMRLVLVAREALFRGQLLVGGQPLTLEDLVECDPAGIDPEFIAALVTEGWLIGDDKAVAIARWSEWYRPPSRMPDAEAARSKARREAKREARPQATGDRPQATGDRPQATGADRTQPTTYNLQPTTEPTSNNLHPTSDPSTDPIQQPTKLRARQNGKRPLPAEAAATLDRLRQHNDQANQSAARGP